MGIAKPFRMPSVTNRSLQHSAWCFPLLSKSKRVETYFCIGILLFTGCTATQVRWDATNIRKQVMVYYNDQIMDNLIRAKNHLAFVHVDITLLTSQGSSQISGTVGAGENRTSEHTIRNMVDALGTLTRTLTHPFAYSVTPQQTETLSIQAAPALGNQALVSLTPKPNADVQPSQTPELTKKTVNFDASHTMTSSTEESTVKPPPTPAPITIYELYADYAQFPPKRVLFYTPTHPQKDTYVPGTLKACDDGYYYIRMIDKDKYYDLCKLLFTKGQSGSLEKKLTEIQAAAALR